MPGDEHAGCCGHCKRPAKPVVVLPVALAASVDPNADTILPAKDK
jgi:hypothetical protein